MRIPRLYTDQELTNGTRVKLDKNASSYLLKVLRLPVDAELHLFNGVPVEGEYGYFTAKITAANKQADISITEFISESNDSPLKITLLQGVSKGDHMDITIQKAVELGVTDIIPLICERTVVNLKSDRLEKKMRHWNGIVSSACEQSGRNNLLKIHPPKKLSELSLSENEIGFILQPTAEKNLQSQETPKAVSIMIGPEGGFTDEEIKLSIDKDFNEVRFGPRILRTETAAIAAVSIIQSLWGDLN